MKKMIPNIDFGKEVVNDSSDTIAVIDPKNGHTIGHVPKSTYEDLDKMIDSSSKAYQKWKEVSVKDRVQILFKTKALLEENVEHLAEIIYLENGKTYAEAQGSIIRGIECVEYACSLPQLITGSVLEVSPGIECKSTRSPLGVVAGISPFNFPLMVPLWMAPLAMACGNAFILKPSEQTPLSSIELFKIFKKAGLPDGIFSIINGDKEIVEAICDHPQIAAIGFVGSTNVAKTIYSRATATGKRVRALGGAKNHLVIVPDADPEMTASNVVASVTGCAGQRCMAASVLLAVGDVDHIINKIKQKMGDLIPGSDLGPLISKSAKDRIIGYLERVELHKGAKLILDGRNKVKDEGFYLGASIIDQASSEHESANEEIFGPVLTIIRCKDLDEALAIENQNPYGNAAAIFTSSGKAAEHFSKRANAGMVGINIGVPVPREPFPFGGRNLSLFGSGDITGPEAINFWTLAKKITSKWSDKFRSNWMS